MIKSLMICITLITVMQKSCGQVNKKMDCTNCTQMDSAISKKLIEMNFNNYEGKEVHAFLEALGYNYNHYIPYEKKPGYISKIIFRYTDSLSVDISVSDLNQTKPLNFGYTLDIEEFKKKKISMICFRFSGRCIKGCKGEPCRD